MLRAAAQQLTAQAGFRGTVETQCWQARIIVFVSMQESGVARGAAHLSYVSLSVSSKASKASSL